MVVVGLDDRLEMLSTSIIKTRCGGKRRAQDKKDTQYTTPTPPAAREAQKMIPSFLLVPISDYNM
jgi:hypothetical protein